MNRIENTWLQIYLIFYNTMIINKFIQRNSESCDKHDLKLDVKKKELANTKRKKKMKIMRKK